MGGTQASPSRADLAELAELRRRAYGPEADIGGDAVACARLIELEAALGFANALRPVEESGSANEWRDASETESIPGRMPVGVAAESPAEPGPVQHSARQMQAPRWWQRRAAILVDLGVAVATLGVLASVLSPPSSDVTLHPRTDVPVEASVELGSADELNYLGISPGDVRLYDEFRGLNIWSGPRGTSTTCMFVTTDARPRWRVDCSPWNGEPTIDLVKYRESSRLSGIEAWGDMPVGSMIRLILRDGVVLAQTVDAPPPLAGPSR
ncbi:hypothetical protein ACPW96_08120 [Micromonospora sp. DT81.3]|uniref:hypothetical protein n=1 Tax=Micromonospora sp. DT81.3 TaxID=3416523 RepID=UPI003CED52C0